MVSRILCKRARYKYMFRDTNPTRTDKAGSQQWTAVGSCRVGVSKRFSRSISLAVYCLYTHFILADQISCRCYVCSVYRMRSLAVSYSFMNFWTVGLFRSDTLRLYKAWYWPCVSMFKCLGWPCPAAFIFCFSRHQSRHFGLLALRNT